MFCDAFFAQLLFFLISRALTDLFPYFPPLPLFPHIAFENLITSYLQRFLFLPRMNHPTESGIPPCPICPIGGHLSAGIWRQCPHCRPLRSPPAPMQCVGFHPTERKINNAHSSTHTCVPSSPAILVVVARARPKWILPLGKEERMRGRASARSIYCPFCSASSWAIIHFRP